MTNHLRIRTVMAERGGAATAAELRSAVGHHRLEAAVRDGVITRVGWGRYVSPSLTDHRRTAFALHGVTSHDSAAAQHGWSTKWQPKQPTVTVRPNRHLTPAQRRGATIAWQSLDPEDIVAGVTAPLRTVLDCALSMPFDEALAIADSALRCGDVRPDELRDATVSGPGCVSARRVLELADGRAANPLESVLRAIALGIPRLQVVPQVEYAGDDWYARVDLADPSLGLVLEAEGFETHGTRGGFDRDCERYVNLVCDGLVVLRFTWTQVMHHPEWVRSRILRTVARRTEAPASWEDPMHRSRPESPEFRAS